MKRNRSAPDKLAAIPLAPELSEERRDDNGLGSAGGVRESPPDKKVARAHCAPQQRQPLPSEGKQQAQALVALGYRGSATTAISLPAARDAADAAGL